MSDDLLELNRFTPSISPSKLLTGLHRLRPNFGSSFYAKGKPIKRNPPPTLPTITLDITSQCSFGCAFCFASPRREAGNFLQLDRLLTLFEELDGMSRFVLIGGEPFEHQDFGGILKAALGAATHEVEVFTNGAAIPPELEAAQQWIENLIDEKTATRLRLTLAVDRWHLEKHGAGILEKRIRVLLALEDKGLISASFNVSDGRIYTHSYLDLPAIRASLQSLSPALWKHFNRLLDKHNVEDSFYLNPLIAQGSKAMDHQTELLRPIDFLLHPELVVRSEQDELQILGALNATWMKQPPHRLVLGDAGQGHFGSVILETLISNELAFDRLPWLRPAFLATISEAEENETFKEEALRLWRDADRADPLFPGLLHDLTMETAENFPEHFEACRIFSVFTGYLTDPNSYFDRLAVDMLAFIDHEDTDHPPYDLSGRPDYDKVRLPVIRRMLGRLAQRNGVASVFSTVENLMTRILEANGSLCPVIIDLHTDPLEPQTTEAIPLTLTVFDTGFGHWPKNVDRQRNQLDPPLKPRLLLTPGQDLL